MAAITAVATAEIVRLREHVMCAMCDELDDRIKRCRLLAEKAKDEITIEGLNLLIEKYEADKRGLHPEHDEMVSGHSSEPAMPWYYFDIRDGDALYPDEEGLDLTDQRAAEIEAARSLAEMAKELPVTEERHHLAIEVRTRDGPAFQAAFIYGDAPTRH